MKYPSGPWELLAGRCLTCWHADIICYLVCGAALTVWTLPIDIDIIHRCYVAESLLLRCLGNFLRLVIHGREDSARIVLALWCRSLSCLEIVFWYISAAYSAMMAPLVKIIGTTPAATLFPATVAPILLFCCRFVCLFVFSLWAGLF